MDTLEASFKGIGTFQTGDIIVWGLSEEFVANAVVRGTIASDDLDSAVISYASLTSGNVWSSAISHSSLVSHGGSYEDTWIIEDIIEGLHQIKLSEFAYTPRYVYVIRRPQPYSADEMKLYQTILDTFIDNYYAKEKPKGPSSLERKGNAYNVLRIGLLAQQFYQSNKTDVALKSMVSGYIDKAISAAAAVSDWWNLEDHIPTFVCSQLASQLSWDCQKALENVLESDITTPSSSSDVVVAPDIDTPVVEGDGEEIHGHTTSTSFTADSIQKSIFHLQFKDNTAFEGVEAQALKQLPQWQCFELTDEQFATIRAAVHLDNATTPSDEKPAAQDAEKRGFCASLFSCCFGPSATNTAQANQQQKHHKCACRHNAHCFNPQAANAPRVLESFVKSALKNNPELQNEVQAHHRRRQQQAQEQQPAVESGELTAAKEAPAVTKHTLLHYHGHCSTTEGHQALEKCQNVSDEKWTEMFHQMASGQSTTATPAVASDAAATATTAAPTATKTLTVSSSSSSSSSSIASSIVDWIERAFLAEAMDAIVEEIRNDAYQIDPSLKDAVSQVTTAAERDALVAAKKQQDPTYWQKITRHRSLARPNITAWEQKQFEEQSSNVWGFVVPSDLGFSLTNNLIYTSNPVISISQQK